MSENSQSDEVRHLSNQQDCVSSLPAIAPVKRTQTVFRPQDVERWFSELRHPNGFMINANGTFFLRCKENEKNEDESDEEGDDDAETERRYSLLRVFSPFKVIRRVEHVSGDVSFDCAFIDSKGRYICVVASSDEFLSTELLKKLTKKGFKVYRPRGAVRLLHSICNDMEAEVPTVRVVPRQGVQPSGSIVIDGLVLGRDSDVTIDHQMKRGFSARGSHAEWVTNVSVPALNSQTIVFAISHSFAALLKYAAGLPDAVFNLLGPSSKGKTMALYASASTMGPRKDMITTWLATGAGFEGLATGRQGWSWIIDEARIGLGDKFEENIIFALLNGRTKSKAAGHGGAGVELSLWALSSNEDREDDPFKGQPRSGADVRLITIPVGYDLIRGIFEKAKGIGDAKAMADAMKEATEHFYGTPIIEFSERLLEQPDWRAEISARLHKARVSILSGRNLDSVKLRGLDSFLPIAAAGEWATELGITGWQPGDATNAVKALFDSYLAGPPQSYWREKRKHDALQSNQPATHQSQPLSDDHLASMFAGQAKASDKLAEDAAAEALAFFRSEQSVPLAKLVADGRAPRPDDPDCPVFIHAREEGSLLCVAPERLKNVLNGRDEIAMKKLRERGILVRNGQPTSLRFTLKVMGEARSFYALSYSDVVGVGDVQP